MSLMDRQTRRAWRKRRVVLAALAIAVIAAGAWWAHRSTNPPQKSTPPLFLVVSGDTSGWIVPCGCTSNQSGGLLRRATYVDGLRVQGGDLIIADAGGAPGGVSDYHRVKFEAILKGELAMGLDVHNLGGPEAALGSSYLREIGSRLSVPFISANLRDGQGNLVAEPLRIVERCGKRIAFVGVLSKSYQKEGITISEPRVAVLHAADRAKGMYDSLVVLAYLPEDELQQLAAGLPEADAVIGGPTKQSIRPRQIGPTLLASAANKGKFLVQLELSGTGTSRSWQGEVVEMGPDYADEPRQQENLKAYLAELGRRDFIASETGLAKTLSAHQPESYRIAGNDACIACHRNDCETWKTSHHAQAWKTIQDKGFHVDSECQRCHTTGFALPGGFASVSRSSTLTAVGCESCHGPSLAHAREPKERTTFNARNECTRCHDRENSPKFEFDLYWPKIKHGAKANVSSSP